MYKDKAVVENPYGPYLFRWPAKGKITIRPYEICRRILEKRPQGTDILFGQIDLDEERRPGSMRLAFGVNLHAGEDERAIVPVGFIDCPNWAEAEEILKERFPFGMAIAQEEEPDATSEPAQADPKDYQPPEPSPLGVLFLTGRHTPYSHLFLPIQEDPYAGMTAKAIVAKLIAPDETILWTGKPEAARFSMFNTFQKIPATLALLLSFVVFPLLVVVGLFLKPLLIPFFMAPGIIFAYWGFGLSFGKWSIGNIVSKAFYAITDKRVLLIAPFSTRLVPLGEAVCSLGPDRIATRVLRHAGSGPAVIFWRPDANHPHGSDQTDFPAIVACPDWHNAEWILREHFDEKTGTAPDSPATFGSNSQNETGNDLEDGGS